MSPERFRKLALSLPESSVSGPTERADFCVRGENFATLFPNEHWALIKLTPDTQAELIKNEPDVFQACVGAWGRQGATVVALKHAVESDVLRALVAAWRKSAPTSLIAGADGIDD